MQITRIYSDGQGESHFEDIDIPIKDAGDIGMLSELVPVTGIIFRETPPDYDFEWHNTPRRQYVLILDGDVEFTVSDGEKREFGTGDIILLEDTTGKGHYSRAITPKVRKSVFVTLD